MAIWAVEVILADLYIFMLMSEGGGDAGGAQSL